ncbi:hypothetical protein BN1723_012002 [Verticillium longisporum]|uniref:AA1-like domain-containing protein n=1 Tax=Verticillium longisporum TaxID=100787 RepID=A0A0G4LD45_VERLO|nr:hypothetical protein BN1723_012002 [Verticillium longisporum]
MQFTLAAAAALFGASALAAPASPGSTGAPPDPNTYENIDIADFNVRKGEDGTIKYVNFKLSGDDADGLLCEAQNPGLPSEVITCGESKYRFALYPGEEFEFALRLYHELGLAFGFYGTGEVFTYCHASGLGDFICQQQNPTTIVIDSLPDAPAQA